MIIIYLHLYWKSKEYSFIKLAGDNFIKFFLIDKKMSQEELFHWTDVAAERVIREKGNKKSYTLAACITPSGTVHIGNFREIITVDLVRKALEKRGKKVRFIYSWDDFDVFRKVPKDMPKQELLQKFLRKPIVETPDAYDCHKSYAEHNEKEVEDSIKLVDVNPEFLYQAKKYRAGEYDAEIKKALENTDKIKECLNSARDENLDDSWLPISIFCAKCGKDMIKELKWLGGYKLSYACACEHKEEFDFREKHLVKLKWRVDWPMRWAYEKVDFEPGGKDHSVAGGSYDTGKNISKAIWNYEAPSYIMYDFINIKGSSGKMSSSKGNVVRLNDVLEVYEPEIVRFIFAGTRPNREFSIAFDVDVLKVYEDFDKCERIYYGEEQVNEKEKIKQSVAYELSAIGKIPKKMPLQPKFRHLTLLLQINNLEIDRVLKHYNKEIKNVSDKKRIAQRAKCALNWLEKYAPDEFRFIVQDKSQLKLNAKEKNALKDLAKKLKEKEWTDTDLHEEIYILSKNHDMEPKDFFKMAYLVLINKEKGPRLASFILEIGRKKVANLLENA